MPTLFHPKLGVDYESVNDEQADSLAVSGWQRKSETGSEPKRQRPRRRTTERPAASKAPATPTAPAAKSKEN